MHLLATYTAGDPPALLLTDLETKEILHTVEATGDARRSLTWAAQQWCKANGHSISQWDRSALTNGECDPHPEDEVEDRLVILDGKLCRPRKGWSAIPTLSGHLDPKSISRAIIGQTTPAS